MTWLWLVIAGAVVVGVTYVGWEFRWYWSTLVRSWGGDADETLAKSESGREMAGHPRPR